jgi:hypothetical protein
MIECPAPATEQGVGGGGQGACVCDRVEWAAVGEGCPAGSA